MEDSWKVDYSQTVAAKAGEGSLDLVEGGGEQSTEVPMLRGVPNRRTFDSGYGGDSQSCVSSPVAEPKMKRDGNSAAAVLTAAESFISECSNSNSRGRTLKRQKAVDRSALSSAQSARSRSSAHSVHHYRRTTSGSTTGARMSSSDYEEYGDDDDADLYDVNNAKHTSLSLGRLTGDSLHMHSFSQSAVKAYGRLRRKTSFNTTSSSEEMAVDDEDEDEQNDYTSSSCCSEEVEEAEDELSVSSNAAAHLQKEITSKLARLQISSRQHGEQKLVSGELSPQIASS